MHTPTALLHTKFFIPPALSAAVHRKRLVARLSGGSARSLTLLSAAAGAGKTTLLREWIDAEHPRAAWLSLDEGDNDPTRFWAHVIGSLQTVVESIGEACLHALRSPQPVPLTAVLTMLLNDAAPMREPLTLIFDDYHVITEKAVHDSLAYFLEHLPPSLFMIIATRVDPMLPLGRMRARGMLTELRDSDLRFTYDETAEFLNNSMGLHLSPTDMMVLESRTEGWIVGLQLAALSLQRLDDSASRTRFINRFAGDDRYILDYLAAEVLQRQPDEIQRFLLDTSILEQLSAPLCSAVTGSAHAQAILEGLEQANLFLIPLDNRRDWYRYHHLFADLLQHQLRRTDPGRVSVLHERASQWYESRGLIPQAVEHAITAGNLANAVRLILTVHHAMIIMHGEPYTLLRWIQMLPKGAIDRYPELGIVHSWALVAMSQPEAARRVLEAARASMAEPIPLPMQGEIAMLLATIGVISSDAALVLENAPIAVALTPEEPRMERSYALWMMGQVYRFKGDAVRAERTFAEAARLGEACESHFVATMSAGNRADRLIEQGKLRAGLHAHRQLQERAMRDGRNPPFIIGDSLIWSSFVMLEWNELDAAEADIARALEINQNVLIEASITGRLNRAQIAAARRDFQAIPMLIQEGMQMAETYHLQHMVTRVGAFQAWLDLMQGNRQAAEYWLESQGYPEILQRVFDSLVLLIIARILAAAHKIDDACKLLNVVRTTAEHGGRFKVVIEALAIEALIHQANCQTTAAMQTLERALVLAEPEGFLRVFLDEGEPMEALLQLARRQNIGQQEYIRHLLRQFSSTTPPTVKSLQTEALSDRETDILRLLVQGYSNVEIAERLYLSVNTVKTHMKHIYEKLDVKNRVEAAERAHELGLLP